MSVEKLEKLNDPEITKAFTQPPLPKLGQKIINFLSENSNLVTTAGGMSYVVTGLDRYKLVELAKGYSINLFKYMFAVKLYEQGLISQNKTD